MAKTKSELKKLTKVQLENYGRTVGIELDRRLKKSTLLTQLEEHMKIPGVIKTVVNRVKAAVTGAVTGEVLLRDRKTGKFYQGKRPSGDKNGRHAGVPYWEV